MATDPLEGLSKKSKIVSDVTVVGDTAYVALTKGFSAIIDAADAPLVAGRRWSCLIGKFGHAYAICQENGSILPMHRLIMAATPGTRVDHRDGDGLNNKRENLRFATPTQNSANKAIERRNKIGLKGVHKRTDRPYSKPYRATIKPNGKTIDLGHYSTPEEAAAAYRGAARALWGEFAKE